MLKFLKEKIEKRKTVFFTVSETYPKMTDPRFTKEALVTNILYDFEGIVIEVTFKLKKER